jgi:hypothetical protein
MHDHEARSREYRSAASLLASALGWCPVVKRRLHSAAKRDEPEGGGVAADRPGQSDDRVSAGGELDQIQFLLGHIPIAGRAALAVKEVQAGAATDGGRPSV